MTDPELLIEQRRRRRAERGRLRARKAAKLLLDCHADLAPQDNYCHRRRTAIALLEASVGRSL